MSVYTHRHSLLKIQEKQGIRSIGIISMFFLILVSLGAVKPVWSGVAGENEQITMRRAEGLAYQILEARKSRGRGIASISSNEMNLLAADQGEIGMDRWGHPYRFKVLRETLKDTNQEKTKIVVWSAGPNGHFETLDPVHLAGDDLGTSILAQ